MNVIVYGDFNCPYSYLASQRADLLSRAGGAVDWRAVEHDRGLPVTGLPSASDRAAWDRELAEVASLALPGEQVPAGPPVLISNTAAAVAAYAEAVSDGVAGELRRRLFQRHLGAGAAPEQRLRGAPPDHRGDVAAGRHHGPAGQPGHSQPAAAGSGHGPDRAPVGRHDRAGRRTADHRRLAADPAVAAGVAGAAQPGDPGGHRPGPGRAAWHRRACGTWPISPVTPACCRVYPYTPEPSRAWTPGLRRPPGRPDEATSTDVAGGGPARTWHAAAGKAEWTGRGFGHGWVSRAFAPLAATVPTATPAAACTARLISTTASDIK